MKATFQKPDASYPHGSLREQPEMKKPDLYDEKYFSPESWRDERFMQDKNLYELKKADCRVIPCSENNWKDGQELTQNVDFVVISNDPDSGKFLALPMEVAVPIVAQEDEEDIYDAVRDYRKSHPEIAQETEDELWSEAAKIILDNHYNFEKTTKLKSEFLIQRRKQ